VLTLLAVVEQTAHSLWVRESPSLWAFPFILYLHTLGLALLAGLSVGLNVWLLGRRTVPPFELKGLYSVMWLGFGINAVSGLVLLIAYPAKALTNWVFSAKLLLVVLALWVVERIKGELVVAAGAGTRAVSPRARQLAVVSLVLWALTILAGRFLAYTHHILLASEAF
jgi:hypothetical protein